MYVITEIFHRAASSILQLRFDKKLKIKQKKHAEKTQIVGSKGADAASMQSRYVKLKRFYNG